MCPLCYADAFDVQVSMLFTDSLMGVCHLVRETTAPHTADPEVNMCAYASLS